jgi:hypothetical protein
MSIYCCRFTKMITGLRLRFETQAEEHQSSQAYETARKAKVMGYNTKGIIRQREINQDGGHLTDDER